MTTGPDVRSGSTADDLWVAGGGASGFGGAAFGGAAFGVAGSAGGLGVAPARGSDVINR